jgi:lipopolysaccharide transport system ATP-binding protein
LTVTVHAEGLSKRYRIGEYRAGYQTLRDTLAHTTRRALRLEHVDHSLEDLWALKDVSFEVEQGEVVGFIGRNGAGKSTLLKLLTRITPPTEGSAWIRGRVGSILEVGTGFHPELTGRENTYLNGAILGMKRREITAKFDDIVEFSGIEKFIDTPVKRYSSGMYVRLAFAVAAHLDPEVLIIDEVLAVGDYEFQQRCMGRIEDISGSGRTVLFVSHDMQAISRLCDRAYWLDGGRVVEEGVGEDVVAEYLRSSTGTSNAWQNSRLDEPLRPDEVVRLESLRIVNRAGETVGATDVRDSVGVEFTFTVHRAAPLFPKIKLTTMRGEVVCNALDVDPRWTVPVAPGTYLSTAWIPGNLLNEGFHSIDAGIFSVAAPKLHPHINIPSILSLHVSDHGGPGSSKGQYTGQLRGVIRPLLEWSYERVDADHPNRAEAPAYDRA